MKNKLKEIQNIQYFTKGHRGILYVGEYKKKKVAIKTERKGSMAIGRIENEINYLKILNKKGIGPKLLFYDKKFTYFVYEYVNGSFFPIFLQHCTRKNKSLIQKIIRNIFSQCFRMDRMSIDKEEMHHPYKHIIIEKKSKPVLIDFERCHKAIEPKNVTQFCSYIISDFMLKALKEKGIKVSAKKVIDSAKKYKKGMKKANLENILKYVNGR